VRKTFVLLTVILLITGSVMAEPFDKGKWTSGLMFGSFKIKPYELKNGVTGKKSEGNYVGFQLSLYSGYFIKDNWVLGTYVDYEVNPTVKTHNDDEDILKIYTAEADAFIGFYSRYYFPLNEKYQNTVNGYKYEQTELMAYGFHINVGAGYTRPINEWISTDFTVSYGIGWLTGENDIYWHGREWKEDESLTRTSFSLMWGLHIYLEESLSPLFKKKEKQKKG